MLSAPDDVCASCKAHVPSASAFNHYHARCLRQMSGQLSDAERTEASSQKARIRKWVIDSYEQAVKRRPGVAKRVLECGSESSLKRHKAVESTTALVTGQGNNENELSITGTYYSYRFIYIQNTDGL
jgi:hypothetical protein